MNHRTIYDTDHTEPLKQSFTLPPNIVDKAHSILPQLQRKTLHIGTIIIEPQLDPNSLLETILDNIHDGDKEELVGNLILMLGWLHKGGTMPNILKDTLTSTTLWIIPSNE